MRIQVKGRNDAIVEAELRARVEKKLAKVARQVSPLADLEVELREESNPSIKDSQIAEATLHLKGVTLRATERSPDMAHSINLLAEDLARQVKKHRDKRRARPARGVAQRRRAQPEPALKHAPERSRPLATVFDDDHSRSRAAGRRGEEVQDLREGRRAHQRLRGRARAGARTRSCRARYEALRERHLSGESLDDLLPESFALTREAGKRSHRPAPLRRSADRRHGPPRRLDRRDEDRRGQDAHGHPADRAQRALLARRERPPGGGQGHPPRHGQRLPGPPRRPVDEADLRLPRRDRRDHPVGAERHRQAGGLLPRRRLRHQLRVRLRLPARQPRRGDRAEGPARPRLRDRRRGGQHPHRRGAHPADHLRPARAGRRPLLQVREAGQDDGAGQEARGPRGQVEGVRGRLRLRARREAQDRGRHRARRREGRALPRGRQPLPRRAREHGQPPPAVAEGGVALQARRGLRRDRRRGQDHRRVHRAHPRGPALVRGPPPGGRGQGGRGDPGGEPDRRHDHLPELLPPLRQARRHDRHRAHRGHRVHEDLRAPGGGGAHQPPDGPRGPERPDLQDQGRQVGGRGQRDRGAPRRRAAGARRARSPSRSRSSCPTQLQQARHQAHGPEREARARRARGRDHRRGRPAGRGHDRHQHGRPWRGHQARRERGAPHPARAGQARARARQPRLGQRLGRGLRRRWRPRSRRTARRSWRPAGSSSAAPSATSRAGSTTSSAAAPAARATRASRASTSRPRTTWCACSPATASTASSTTSSSRRRTTTATSCRSSTRCSRSRSRTPRRRSRSRTS